MKSNYVNFELLIKFWLELKFKIKILIMVLLEFKKVVIVIVEFDVSIFEWLKIEFVNLNGML